MQPSNSFKIAKQVSSTAEVFRASSGGKEETSSLRRSTIRSRECSSFEMTSKSERDSRTSRTKREMEDEVFAIVSHTPKQAVLIYLGK